MAQKEKISLPATGGGIFRTYEEEGKGLKLKPEYIIYLSTGVVVFELLLHFYGAAIF